ncbi:MAG TPA: hypothetical protein VMI54_02505 [Polyangiaceae bacterium]|nr:hypothetical protein [Polyangiaceae bacterium]
MGLLRLGAFSAAVSLASCGSTTSPTATTDEPPLYICQTFTPCHDGNVVGRWKLDHVCIDQDSVQMSTSCGDTKNSSSVTEITGYTATGTLDIEADGSASFETDEHAYERLTHPAACSSDPTAATAFCDNERDSGASCTLTDGSCDCTWVSESMWPTPTSTYHAGDASIFGLDYCVNGAGLTLRNEMGASGGDYVFVPE